MLSLLFRRLHYLIIQQMGGSGDSLVGGRGGEPKQGIEPSGSHGCLAGRLDFWGQHTTIQPPTKGDWSQNLIKIGPQSWMTHLFRGRKVMTVLYHNYTQSWPVANFLTHIGLRKDLLHARLSVRTPIWKKST